MNPSPKPTEFAAALSAASIYELSKNATMRQIEDYKCYAVDNVPEVECPKEYISVKNGRLAISEEIFGIVVACWWEGRVIDNKLKACLYIVCSGDIYRFDEDNGDVVEQANKFLRSWLGNTLDQIEEIRKRDEGQGMKNKSTE